jgi:hypothetical protein
MAALGNHTLPLQAQVGMMLSAPAMLVMAQLFEPTFYLMGVLIALR